MEIFDLFDKNRIPLNKTMIRGNKVPEDCYRMVVHCALLNKEGNKMLIQKRLATKNPYPDLWDFTCGGSVISGETSSQGVQRELFEEIGFNYDFSNSRPDFTFNFKEGCNDFYVILTDVDLNKLKLQETEVECVKWASLEEILNMIDSGKFIPYKKSLMQFIFEVRNSKRIIKD